MMATKKKIARPRGVGQAAWDAMTPSERFAATHPNYDRDLKPPLPPLRPSVAREASLLRLTRLIEDLETIKGRLSKLDLTDQDVAALMQHVDSVWAKHQGAESLQAPAMIMLSWCVEQDALEGSPYMFDVFCTRYPDLGAKLTRDGFMFAVADWKNTRRRWKGIRDALRACGLSPATTTTIKNAYYKHRRAIEAARASQRA